MHRNATQTHSRSAPTQHGQQSPSYYVEQVAMGHPIGASGGILTTTLVHAISDVTGVDTTDVEAAIAEEIDLDALDRVFRTGSAGAGQLQGTFSLTLWGHRVTIYSGDGVVVVPPQANTGASPSAGGGRPQRPRR
jgi:hypothetical protein